MRNSPVRVAAPLVAIASLIHCNNVFGIRAIETVSVVVGDVSLTEIASIRDTPPASAIACGASVPIGAEGVVCGGWDVWEGGACGGGGGR